MSPLPSQAPEVLEGHMGSIASCCSHHSSSWKRAEIGSGGQLQTQEMGLRAVPAELPHLPAHATAERGVDTPSSPHAGLAPCPHPPALLLQPPRRVSAPSPAHQGGLHFHTGTSQELGTDSLSRMVLAGQSTAGPKTSLHGRCSASRALCELAVPGPGLCAHQCWHHQSDAQS